MSKKVLAIVVVLFVAGVAVIIMAGTNMAKNKTASTGTTGATNQSTAPAPKPGTVQQTNILGMVQNPPGASATKEEIQTFNEILTKAAVYSPTLDVTGCNPVPQVMLIKGHPNFTLVNKDSTPHLLEHSRGIHLEALANSQNDVTLPPTLSPGTYGYTCDKKLAGVLYVTP